MKINNNGNLRLVASIVGGTSLFLLSGVILLLVDNHTYSNVRHVRHNQCQAYKKAYDSYRVCNIKYADPFDAELYCRKEPLLSTYGIE